MSYRWIRKPAWLGLGLSATLLAALSGCGDSTADKDHAVVVPEPNANIGARSSPTSAGAAGATSGGTGGTATPATTTTASSPVKAEGWGTLKGRVIFNGTPPQPAVLQEVGKAQKDPEVCAKTAPIMSERLVVNSGTKGVKNVFVYLQRPTAVNEEAKKAALARHPEFDQKNCTYIPHVLAIMTGETVTVKTSDPVNHNVNFGLKNFTQNPVMPPGDTKNYTLDSAERAPGPVTCNIHPWMQAYWLVLDHPYSAVTDENGNFEIKNAPAGTQKVVVWQEATGYVTAPSGDSVDIKPNDTVTKDFQIDPAKVRQAG
jgi:plastocyanin